MGKGSFPWYVGTAVYTFKAPSYFFFFANWLVIVVLLFCVCCVCFALLLLRWLFAGCLLLLTGCLLLLSAFELQRAPHTNQQKLSKQKQGVSLFFHLFPSQQRHGQQIYAPTRKTSTTPHNTAITLTERLEFYTCLPYISAYSLCDVLIVAFDWRRLWTVYTM